MSTPSDAKPQPALNLFDATALIVGIVIGSGIYRANAVAVNVSDPLQLALVWGFGGFMALVGALTYAELSTTYTQVGGDYIYLTRAWGKRVGFLYSWAQLWIVRPGSVGAMAYIFASYAQQLKPLGGSHPLMIYAGSAVTALIAMNMLGVQGGKWTQNVLTTAKVLGLLTICGAAFVFADPASTEITTATTAVKPDFRQALVIVMFIYGGYSEMSFVAAEVRNPSKNLVRALVLGTLSVMAIYFLANFAFLYTLGFSGMQQSSAVAADTLRASIGPGGARIVSVLVCISSLGAMNGAIFTGARIYYATGEDHPLLSKLHVWNARLGTPIRALALQGAITLAAVLGAGVNSDGFERLVNFTAPIGWGFSMLVGISLFVLRRKDPDATRTFLVPGYPITPLLFCLSCGFVAQAGCMHAWDNASIEAALAVGLLAVGVLLCWFEPGSSRNR